MVRLVLCVGIRWFDLMLFCRFYVSLTIRPSTGCWTGFIRIITYITEIVLNSDWNSPISIITLDAEGYSCRVTRSSRIVIVCTSIVHIYVPIDPLYDPKICECPMLMRLSITMCRLETQAKATASCGGGGVLRQEDYLPNSLVLEVLGSASPNRVISTVAWRSPFLSS